MTLDSSWSRSGRLLAIARVRAADRLHRWVLGTLAGTLPTSAIRSLEEHSHRADVAAHVSGQHPWRGMTMSTYALPEQCGPGFRRVKAFDARQIWELSDVCVSPSSGLVWLPEGRVLEESVGALRRIIGWGDVRSELLRRVSAADVGAPVLAVPPVPFFHWLLEVLPAVVGALEVRPDCRLLLHDASPPYVTAGVDWLREVGLHAGGLLWAGGPLRVPQLVLPAIDPFSGFVHPDDVAALRTTLLPTVMAGRGPSEAVRVYISRRRAPARALGGEAVLEASLAADGVRPIVLEDLALRSQVRLFARAATVVAPHGAGLAHLVWCRPGTEVVEIFPYGFRNDCYARLSASLGLRYAYVEAGPSGSVGVDAVRARLDG